MLRRRSTSFVRKAAQRRIAAAVAREQYRAAACARRAFTLVEMLVAMALTLILVYAIAEFYAFVGDTVRDGRAMIEMSGEMRAVSTRLKADLDSLTVAVKPYANDGAAPGYFEYFEGLAKDSDVNANSTTDTGEPAIFTSVNATSMLGDADDIIAFTIRSTGEAFTGKYNGNTVRSNLAEVIWWVGFNDVDGDTTWDLNEPRFLFRRQLLILPNLNDPTNGALAAAGTYIATEFPKFFYTNDISARRNPGTGAVIANSLTDLCRRENRFAHDGTANLMRAQLQMMSKGSGTVDVFPMHDTSNRLSGEDIILSNLLGFDVRAYDPYAPIVQDAEGITALIPGDPNFSFTLTQIGSGAYVDLGYDSDTSFNADSDWTTYNSSNDDRSHFSVQPQNGYGNTYDTWAASYDRTQNSGRANNGIDDDGANGVDDAGERLAAASAPYPYPLRGIQVRIRMYEPSTRQTRQATVIADFLPE